MGGVINAKNIKYLAALIKAFIYVFLNVRVSGIVIGSGVCLRAAKLVIFSVTAMLSTI